jgi:uncharacterized linocin/CFP29 family protein
MHSDLVECGWTEEQWNRVCGVVAEEAQKARVGARVLPLVGPEDPSTTAIPALGMLGPPYSDNPWPPPDERLVVDSDPNLPLTTIAVNVPLRAHELADPELKAAMTMFRRAANYVARLEDALVFNGRSGPDVPPVGATAIAPVFRVTGSGVAPGIFVASVPGPRQFQPLTARDPALGVTGEDVFTAVIEAINRLEGAGQLGPYGCVLSHELFTLVCTPTDSMVMPRDRLLPFLEGPLYRSSQVLNPWGCVIALSGSPIELVVASDIHVRFLQTTLEPRYVFRVSERVALRIKEPSAIALLR